MNLTLRRTESRADCVKGNLYINGSLECFTLEPPQLFEGHLNVPDKTCILEGTYTVVRTMSQRFGHDVPVIVNVPGRTNIEIHPLNRPDQTEGCIGVGYQWMDGSEIGESDLAFGDLMITCILAWDSREGVVIEIEGDYEPVAS